MMRALIGLVLAAGVAAAAALGLALKPYEDYHSLWARPGKYYAKRIEPAAFQIFRIDSPRAEPLFAQPLARRLVGNLAIALPAEYRAQPGEWPEGSAVFYTEAGHRIAVLDSRGGWDLWRRAALTGALFGHPIAPVLPARWQGLIESRIGGEAGLFERRVASRWHPAAGEGIIRFQVGPYGGYRFQRDWTLYEVTREGSPVAAVLFARAKNALSEDQEVFLVASLAEGRP